MRERVECYHYYVTGIHITTVALVGFFSSFIGTNVGGQGLLITPVLILLGLPPQIAVGTSRVGSLGGMVTGFVQFQRGGKVNYRIGIPSTIVIAIGSLLGARSVLLTGGELFENLIAIFLLAMVIFTIAQRNIGITSRPHPTLPLEIFGHLLFVLIGFLGAFFSGGSGIIGRYVLMLVFGQTLLESAGTRKIQSVGLTLPAALIFILSDIVHWPLALALVLGDGLGAWFGAAYGLRKGDRFLRPLFLIVITLSAIALLF